MRGLWPAQENSWIADHSPHQWPYNITAIILSNLFFGDGNCHRPKISCLVLEAKPAQGRMSKSLQHSLNLQYVRIIIHTILLVLRSSLITQRSTKASPQCHLFVDVVVELISRNEWKLTRYFWREHCPIGMIPRMLPPMIQAIGTQRFSHFRLL